MSSVNMDEVASYSSGSDDEDDEVDYGDSDDDYDAEALEEGGSDASVRSSQGLAAGSGSSGYKIIDTAAASRLQEACSDYICSVLGCKHSVAKSLLMHFRWDKEALLSTMADKGAEHLYSVAGVVDASALPEQTEVAAVGNFQCEVCCSDVDAKGFTTMDCRHSYCNTCWSMHFAAKISEGQSRQMRCMAFKCGMACDEDKVRELLASSPDLLEKYRQALLQSYIEDNSNARFCPSVPWCGRAVQVEGDPFCEPECSCGATFCFKCGQSPHSPCTCAMWEKWDEKISGDSETRNWLLANTKACPKCNKQVEKNGGCNHVVCKCGQAFCWLCGACTGMSHSWSAIEGHSCGRWKDELDKKIDEAGRSHKRYMHYFERFKLHNDSFEKEKKKRIELQKRIDSKVEVGVECRDYSWLVTAVDQLRSARGVLAPSYVFAYFFFGNDLYKEDFTPEENTRNQMLFENQQQLLEAEVERLAAMVEKCADTLTIDSQERGKVINSSVNIHERILRLFDLIETDLYGSLQTCVPQIAMFQRKRNIAG